MAFRNLLNRPSSALRFQWDSLEQLSFIICKCQKDRGFPEVRGVVGIKFICNCCSGLGSEALETFLPLFLLWICAMPLEWHKFAHPSSSWIFQCSIENKNCRGICLGGFILFFPLSCASTESSMDFGGLCRSITVRNYYQSRYQGRTIYNLKAGIPIKSFVYS